MTWTHRKKKEGQQFKVVITGDAAVGKTTLLTRYFTGEFTENQPVTIGVNARAQTIRAKDALGGITNVPGESDTAELDFQYWDLGGQSLFNQIRPVYIAGANGIMICFSMNDKRSLFKEDKTEEDRSIGFFLQEIEKAIGEEMYKVPILLVGTKDDLEREIPVSNISYIAKSLRKAGMNIISYNFDRYNGLQIFGDYSKFSDKYKRDDAKHYVITSSKTGKNIRLAFKIIQAALQFTFARKHKF